MKTALKNIVAYVLRSEAQLVLKKYQPRIIAVTGSVGKTSTKDAVYAVLSNMTYVRKSEKSYNSEIGLPLTILGLPNGWSNPFTWLENVWKGFWLILSPHKYPKWLVLEAGVGKPGDIKKTAGWLRTDVVIMTAISETPPHIEFFQSRRHLIEEKMELIKTLKPDGLLVLNYDSESVREMKEKFKHRATTFGFEEGADVRASGDMVSYNERGEPSGMVFRIDESGRSLPVTVPGVFGRNHIYAALAALAVVSGSKWNMVTAVDALRDYEAPPGRMRLLRGIKSSWIIDDTYNSSPLASKAALATLKEIKKGRKIAVLGDMLELGKHTRDAHIEIGFWVKENADVLMTVGQRAKAIAEGAREAGMAAANIFEFLEAKEAGKFLKDFIDEKEKDTVLVKGSQGMRMERAVEAILLDQKNKKNLLVRQDEEWRRKK